MRSADECVAPGRHQPRETRWASDGRLSSPETNLKVGLLPLFFMQLLLSHIFLSFMVRTSPLTRSLPRDVYIRRQKDHPRWPRTYIYVPPQFRFYAFVNRVRSGYGKSGKSMEFVFSISRPGKSMEICEKLSQETSKKGLELFAFNLRKFWRPKVCLPLGSCCRAFDRKQFEGCIVFSHLFLFIVQTA